MYKNATMRFVTIIALGFMMTNRLHAEIQRLELSQRDRIVSSGITFRVNLIQRNARLHLIEEVIATRPTCSSPVTPLSECTYKLNGMSGPYLAREMQFNFINQPGQDYGYQLSVIYKNTILKMVELGPILQINSPECPGAIRYDDLWTHYTPPSEASPTHKFYVTVPNSPWPS